MVINCTPLSSIWPQPPPPLCPCIHPILHCSPPPQHYCPLHLISAYPLNPGLPSSNSPSRERLLPFLDTLRLMLSFVVFLTPLACLMGVSSPSRTGIRNSPSTGSTGFERRKRGQIRVWRPGSSGGFPNDRGYKSAPDRAHCPFRLRAYTKPHSSPSPSPSTSRDICPSARGSRS